MGTNFYYRTNICTCCDRYDEAHVGKNSGGWSFAFRAYPHDLFNTDHPDWGYDPQSPFGFPILSRADWRKAFTDTASELWDEYGHRVEGDPSIWLASLERPDVNQVRKEQKMTSIPYWAGSYSPGAQSWRDAEGFRFDAGEFS